MVPASAHTAARAGILVLLAVAGCSQDAEPPAHPDGGFTGGGAAMGAGGAPGAGGSAPTGGNIGVTGGASAAGGRTAAGGAGSGGVAAPGGAGSGGTPETGVVALGVRWLGRVDATGGNVRFEWSGSGFEARFSGTGLSVELEASDRLIFLPIADGAPLPAFTAAPGSGTYAVAAGLPPGDHAVSMLRETEGQEGHATISAVTVQGGALTPPSPAPARFFEIYGDSISAGYGNLGGEPTCPFSVDTESHHASYGAVAARALQAELNTIAVSGRGVYRNYEGTFGDPLPVYFRRTLTMSPSPVWSGRKPAAVVVNLGTNDFAKGDPGAAFDNAYEAFIAELRAQNPDAQLVCAVGPMLAGAALARVQSTVDAVIDDRRRRGDTRIDKLEFATQVAGEMGCDYHPNAEKHASMGAALAQALRARLGW